MSKVYQDSKTIKNNDAEIPIKLTKLSYRNDSKFTERKTFRQILLKEDNHDKTFKEFFKLTYQALK